MITFNSKDSSSYDRKEKLQVRKQQSQKIERVMSEDYLRTLRR